MIPKNTRTVPSKEEEGEIEDYVSAFSEFLEFDDSSSDDSDEEGDENDEGFLEHSEIDHTLWSVDRRSHVLVTGVDLAILVG